MTAEERYKECKTIEELEKEFWYNKMSAGTWEYLDACEKAYKKRLAELKEVHKCTI